MIKERTTARTLSVFKSEEGQIAYLAAYKELLALWPVPFESIYVPTEFGVTHALVAGPEDGPSLILLPAVSNSAASWFMNIGALSKERRVYAIDVIGDAGRSALYGELRKTSEIADWLTGVFDRLKLECPAVAGHSYGGWLALNLALHAPERVSRLVLIAPAASLRQFRLPTAVGLRIPSWFPLAPPAIAILQRLVTDGYVLQERFVELMEMTVQHTRTRLLFPAVFADDELRRLEVPTLLVLGEEEVIYDPELAIARAKRLIPNLEVELIPNASHLLTMQQSDTVNSRILEFLGSVSDKAAPLRDYTRVARPDGMIGFAGRVRQGGG